MNKSVENMYTMLEKESPRTKNFHERGENNNLFFYESEFSKLRLPIVFLIDSPVIL